MLRLPGLGGLSCPLGLLAPLLDGALLIVEPIQQVQISLSRSDHNLVMHRLGNELSRAPRPQHDAQHNDHDSPGAAAGEQGDKGTSARWVHFSTGGAEATGSLPR